MSCIGADITIESASKFVENVASSYGGAVYLESSCKTIVKAAIFSGNVAGGSNDTICPRIHGAGGGAFAVVGIYDVSSVSEGATNLEISQGTVLTQNKAIDGGAIFVLSPNEAATTSSASVYVPSVPLYADGAVVAVRGGRRFMKTQPSDVTALAKSAELEAVFTQALVLLPHRIPSSLKTSPLPTEVAFERSTMWRP